MREMCKELVGKLWGKRTTGRPKIGWKDNMGMDHE